MASTESFPLFAVWVFFIVLTVKGFELDGNNVGTLEEGVELGNELLGIELLGFADDGILELGDDEEGELELGK
jgi:hypothetical protein